MRAIRFPAFLILATLILVGPAYGHFFATGSHRYLGWKMFSRKASDFCAVDYWQVAQDGTRVPLDRFEIFGHPKDDPKRKPPKHIWRVKNQSEARRFGRIMCKKLGGDVDVRVAVRCASKTLWVDVEDGSENLCTGGRR